MFARPLETLAGSSDFQRTIADGIRHSGRYLMLFVRSNQTGRVRLGVAASARAGNNVVRNRLKRLLREAGRREGSGWRTDFDVVLIAKASAVGCGLEEISADLAVVAGRAGLYQPS